MSSYRKRGVAKSHALKKPIKLTIPKLKPYELFYNHRMITNIALSIPSQIEQAEPHIEYSRALLKSNFLADSRPWVVAYSGGKDSTLVLQLVYELLLSLDSQQHKPVYIVSSDTRVEAPNIESYLEASIAAINKHAATSNLPIHAELIQPPVDQGFWGNLIGKRYPPPTRWFRWCTSKMKIKPAKSAIEDVIRQHGSVILLLGTRTDESSSRGHSMNARELSSRMLNPHHEIPNALVLSPISKWTSDEVWEYLFTHNPPPWGESHDFMLDLYRQANVRLSLISIHRLAGGAVLAAGPVQ